MKRAVFLSLFVSLMSFMASQMALASEGTSQVKIENPSDSAVTDFQFRLIPQVGMSSMSYSGNLGGDAGQGFLGGLTTEVGTSKARMLETGLLYIQQNSDAAVGPNGSYETIHSSQLAIPLMAKLRFLNLQSQQWYLKVGALTEFQTSSDHFSNTNGIDVLGSLGVGARLPVSRTMDLIVEATYNRGLMNVLSVDNSTHDGFLFFTGLSIGI